MNRNPWVIGIGGAALVACMAAGIVTLMDWRLNPGGLFRGAAGTNWPVVGETWIGWFALAFLLMAVVLVPALLWYARRRRRA